MSFTYATVCSGVEGCSLALEGMDWKPVFFSEIEPFPCAVLKSHYPDVPNLGDMSKISYNKEKGIITNGTRTIQFSGRLDLLAGGTPCQDFSVAGKRAGGEKGSGTRSSLCWEWLRLVSELGPRVVLWENVVGTFSSNNGRDFYEFVREVANLGYCVSWRVLDAQYTRVDRWPMAIPQRRRRVWLVGCAADNVAEVAEILFEHRSIVGDTPPRRVTRQEASRIAQNGNQVHAPMVGGECIAIDGDKLKQDSPGCAYGIGNSQANTASAAMCAKEVSQALDCMHDPQTIMESRCFENHPHDSRITDSEDCVQTITQQCGTGGGNLPLVVSTNSNGGDVMPTINANESKLGGDNQHITRGGTLSVNFEMYDTAEDVNVSLCAKRARDCMVVTDESLDASN